MKTVRYIKIVPIRVTPIGNFRSIPAEIDITCPQNPPKSPRPLEHPQISSATVEDFIPPVEPANDSTLALKFLPESPSDQPEVVEQ